MKFFRILVAVMLLLAACGKPAPVPAGEKPVSADPSFSPSADPSEDNSAEPSQTGSEDPSAEPSQDPSEEPSVDFSIDPDPNPHKLAGNIIGSLKSVDYDTGEASVTKNTKDMVFDGKYDTFFASYDRSRTWVGLDLGAKHIITRVGYSPRISQEGRVELALFEGANSPDFSDALPLVLIKEKGRSSVMQYLPVDCSRGFRYVRYVGAGAIAMGGFISLGIGALLYIFVVRRVLMRDGSYVNLWPSGLDLEDMLYRPLLTKWLPDIGGTVARVFGENLILTPVCRCIVFLGSLIGRILCDSTDALILLLRKSIVREMPVRARHDMTPTRMEVFLRDTNEAVSTIFTGFSFALGMTCFGVLLILGVLAYLLFF